ncbi:hypothetical protein [Paraburkholderia sp. BL6669N2]|nr:hypothetical protein [Paraburkholderia sp. BL6669N2]
MDNLTTVLAVIARLAAAHSGHASFLDHPEKAKPHVHLAYRFA